MSICAHTARMCVMHTCTHTRQACFRLLSEVILLDGDKAIVLSLFSTDLDAFCVLPSPGPGLPRMSTNVKSLRVMPLETPVTPLQSLSFQGSGPLQWGCSMGTPSTWFPLLRRRLYLQGAVSGPRLQVCAPRIALRGLMNWETSA